MADVSPENQHDINTSGIATNIGKVTGLSPKKIDNIIDSYGGYVGDLLQAGTSPKNAGENTPQTIANAIASMLVQPLEKRFTADPVYNSGVVDDFYTLKDEATKTANDKNIAENIPATIRTPEEKALTFVNELSAQLSDLYKQEKAMYAEPGSYASKRDESRALREQMNELARGAEEQYQKIIDDEQKKWDELSGIVDIQTFYDEVAKAAAVEGDKSRLSRNEAVVMIDNNFDNLSPEKKALLFDLAGELTTNGAAWKNNPYR